jgi:hypothetical protein
MFDINRQVSNAAHRVRCLATLRAGDVVQAIDPETGAVLGTRLLDAVDDRRKIGGGSASDWPQRYRAGDWRTDDAGCQLDEAQERVEMGWVLVRPPLTAAEATHLLEKPKQKPPFSWELYERHMRLTHLAVLHGFAMPEEPWA